MKDVFGRFSGPAYAAMRIVLAFLYLSHGLQKLFGAFGGPAFPVTSLLGTAALIETVLGSLILIGLLTSCSAFVASGEMAVAYFIGHGSKGGWPIQNGGELAVLLCFAFLYIATRGGGSFSLDAALRRR